MSHYMDGSRVVYWDDTNGNLTVPATLTATSIIGASFTLGPNVTFSSVTASTINVGSLTTPTVSTLRLNASSITGNTVSSLREQTGVFTGTQATVSSLVGNNVSSLRAQLGILTTSTIATNYISTSQLALGSVISASDIQVRTSTLVASQDMTIVGDVFNYNSYVANSIDYSAISTAFTTFSNSSGVPFVANNYTSYPAISANGQTQVITGLSTVWRSLDYGSSWVSTTTLNDLSYYPPAVSATGKLITVPTRVVVGGAANYLYMTSDFGSNWLQGSILKLWNCVAMSASGQYQIAGTVGDSIYITSNYGTTWTAVAALGTTTAWQSVALSASGQYMTAAPYNATLYTSSDYGVTWASRASGGSGQPWGRISMSASGKYQIAPAVTTGNPTYISSDYGLTWAGSSALKAGSAIMSYSGQYVLGANQSYTFAVISSDYGSNFVGTTIPSGFVYNAAMSATAQYMIALGSAAFGSNSYRSIFPILFRAGLSTTQIITSSLVGINLSSLTAQTGVLAVSSLVGSNVSSLTSQTGVFTGTHATVSSLVGNNLSSLTSQTGVFTGTRTTVSSLVGNNVSSLSAQTGVFTGSQATVSSLVGNNLSSLTTQTGVFTGSQATVSSLVGTNLSSLSAQTGVFTGSQATVSSLVANNLSSLSAQTGSFTTSSIISLTMSTGSAIAKTLTVSSIAGFSPISFVNDVIFTSTVSVLAPMSTVSIATSSISANGIVAGAISSLSLNVGSLTALSFSPPPAISVSTFTVNTSSIVGNNVSSLSAQTGSLTANQITTSSILSLSMSTGSIITRTLTVSSILGFSPVSFVNDVIFRSTVSVLATMSTVAIQTSSITTNTLIGGAISSLSLNVGSLTALSFTPPPFTSVSTFAIQTSSLVANNVSSLFQQTGVLTVSSLSVSNIVSNNLNIQTSSLTAQISTITVNGLYDTITSTDPLTLPTFAQSFQQRGPFPAICTYTALSGTGQYQLGISNNSLYLSSDFGATWIIVGPSGDLAQISISRSGQYMFVADRTSVTGNIYRSINYGITWTSVGLTAGSFFGCGVSETGQYVLVGTSSAAYKVYLSSNYGVSFSEVSDIAAGAKLCAISSTGQYMLVSSADSPAYTFLSSNYGTSFSQVGSIPSNVFGVAVSGTGQYQLACLVSPSGLYRSSDYGASFSLVLSQGGGGNYMFSCAIDYTGQYQIAIVLNNSFLYSTDYGVTWTTSPFFNVVGNLWYGCAISGNAQYITAARATYFVTTNCPITLNASVNGNVNILQTLTLNSAYMPISGYTLLANTNEMFTYNNDSGRTFLLDIANSATAVVWLPSTSLISRGWNCKVVNMNASGSTSNGSIYVSSPQAILYAHGNTGRSTMSFVNITGGVGTNYNYYGNFVFDGASYYALH